MVIRLETFSNHKNTTIAVWALTPGGAKLAAKIATHLPDVSLYFSKTLADDLEYHSDKKTDRCTCSVFKKLFKTLAKTFNDYDGHVFIMSTGIVVRMIAPLIRRKTVDPAVVVIDDRGQHAVSLLAGHIGGANALTIRIAELIGADPVITTATDVNRMPAIDLLAKEKNLRVENPETIKTVNMAFLTGRKICFHDPFDLLFSGLAKSDHWRRENLTQKVSTCCNCMDNNDAVRVFIDDIACDLPPHTLILRPPSLVAGIGCNRNTAKEEIKAFLHKILKDFRLAAGSLKAIATVNIKCDEPGLLELANDLKLPIDFFDKEKLKQVEEIQTPSAMVEKHIGVKSVCEAAAILAANKGKLIVPKHSTRNVTIAIARAEISSTS